MNYKEKILLLRSAIRLHRDQVGDDRCWIDDYYLWDLVPGSDILIKPSFEDGMIKCKEFFLFRRNDVMPNNDARVFSDEDLEFFNDNDLTLELNKIENAIIKHRDITNRPRTWMDDEELYFVLPEKLSADFRLPSEEDFLGRGKDCAGCPNFWDSHNGCSIASCNLHSWGPCPKD